MPKSAAIRFLSLILLVIAMNAFAVSTPRSIKPDESDYQAILALARGAVEHALDKPAALDVRQLQALDGFAFLRAQMTSPGGAPLDFGDTPLADSAAAGGVSRSYVALLRRDSGAWRIVADRVGPTDVAWETWSEDYGAPAALFDSP